jgi:hypothetical protein
MRIAATVAGVILGVGQAGPALAQDAVETAYRAALTASPTPIDLTMEQTEWSRGRGEATAAEQDARDAERIGLLRVRTERDRAAGAARLTAADLARTCVPLGLDACQTSQGGWLRRRDGAVLYWQVQSGSTEMDGVSGAVALLAPETDGRLRPVGWTYGGFYQPPVLIEAGDKTWVAAPGVWPGSGSHNADVVFRWTDDARAPLAQIDNLTWLDELKTRLPDGFEVWKGVRIDYGLLYATTPLWRTEDANCCATGGSAGLSFALSDERLTLEDVSVKDALMDLALTTPTDVFDYAGRMFGCIHFGGEPRGDAERTAQIEQALTELRCDTIEAEGAALKTKYADRPNVLGDIARIRAQGGG